jgi:F0F1-type ATP synthase delta subunit
MQSKPRVVVTTATALSADDVAAVRSALEQKLGTIQLDLEVNEKLLGGLTVTVNGKEYDASIAGSLTRLPQIADVPIVSTVIELSTEQKKLLADALEKKTGSREFIHRIEPEIIGGIKIILNSRAYDASVRGKLQKIRAHLLSTTNPLIQ